MTVTTTKGQQPTITLDASDRCDRCGAQAYVATAHHTSAESASLLLWCAHHAAQHAEALAGSLVIDERHRLTGRTPSRQTQPR